MSFQKDILWRVYIIYFVICLFGAGIFARIIYIQFVEGDKWREKAESFTIVEKDVEAIRGNILSDDGSLLATSVPIYEIRMDVMADAINDLVFDTILKPLCDSLTLVSNGISSSQWEHRLKEARNGSNRYLLIKRRVRYAELQRIKEFPLFSRGRMKGGFIVIQQNKRARPFRMLAKRTIGRYREGKDSLGIEGAYNDYLQGASGKQLMRKIPEGQHMPVDPDNVIDPKNGKDVVTTIDIGHQDVAEKALMDQLKLHKARSGCAVLMEVKTGYVKAIANLSMSFEDSSYYEFYNHAVGESAETGSTFKLASFLVALEDGYVKLTDSINAENGCTRFYDQRMCDVHRTRGKMTLANAFVKSSNVVTAKMINENYKERQSQYIQGLADLGLVDSMALGIDLLGEGLPRIKNPKEDDWSGVTLPWMSIGYEVKLTPLQILTFYNAVANDGRMVKPQFVSRIQEKGSVVKEFPPVILKESIASQENILAMRDLMTKVVEEGTAQKVKSPFFSIAGKTGTRQKLVNGQYSNTKHVASFVGYFPADNPKYSCIVIIDEPSRGKYYGGSVAGPVFLEIARSVFASDLEIHEDINSGQPLAEAPISKNGFQKDIRTICKKLELPFVADDPNAIWVNALAKDSVKLFSEDLTETLDKGLMPNLKGMVGMDVLHLLENRGVIVRMNGYGKVVMQSINPGKEIKKGEEVILELG